MLMKPICSHLYCLSCAFSHFAVDETFCFPMQIVRGAYPYTSCPSIAWRWLFLYPIGDLFCIAGILTSHLSICRPKYSRGEQQSYIAPGAQEKLHEAANEWPAWT